MQKIERNYMPHEEVKEAFNEIYNKFYLKNRRVAGVKRSDEEWESLIDEADYLLKKYDSQLVRKIINGLMCEFECGEKEELYNE